MGMRIGSGGFQKRPDYEMAVLVHGQPVTEYHHTDGKIYIEGRRGSEFTLRIRNNTFGRVLAVVSVDGLSVMDGKTASFASGGYIVKPLSYVDIPGWRLDNQDVAKFFFSHLEASYAAQMDKPQNVGVIGCAIFKEKDNWPVIDFLSDYSFGVKTRGGDLPIMRNGCFGGDTVATKSLGAGPSRSIGTGFGSRQRHDVRTVAFDREDSPLATLEIHYAERDDLLRYGVNLYPRPEVSAPKPFPGEAGCKPPAGWRG